VSPPGKNRTCLVKLGTSCSRREEEQRHEANERGVPVNDDKELQQGTINRVGMTRRGGVPTRNSPMMLSSM
jgi:hypothetical protein